MIEKTETYLRGLQADTCVLILRSDPRVMDYVRALAKDAGLKVGDKRLRKEIVRPAYRNFRRPPAR